MTDDAVLVDSSVLIAVAFAEPGAGELADLVNRYRIRLMASINLTEFAIVAARRMDATIARSVIGRFGIVCGPADAELSWDAAAAKLRWPRLNLGDACAVALALRLQIPIATLDDDFRGVPGLVIVP